MTTTLIQTTTEEIAVKEPLVEEPQHLSKPQRKRSALSWSFIVPTGVVLIAVLWTLFPGFFTAHSPIDGVAGSQLQAPSAQHWFGTDHVGRDMFSRVVYGTRQTLLTATLAVFIGVIGGSAVGIAAGTLGKASDSILMRFVDVLLSIPAILIALLVVTINEPGPVSIGVGVGIAAIAAFARVARAETLRVRNLDFIEAAFVNGGTYFSVVRKHLVPNAAGPILSLVITELGTAILVISSLGFLGFGSPPPTPEWGLLIAEGREYIASAWWLITFPGLIIITVVVSLGLLSRHLLAWLRV